MKNYIATKKLQSIR